MTDPEKRVCIICGATLTYFRKENFYRCPVCHTEVWPNEERIKQLERERQRALRAEEERERNKWAVGSNFNPEALPIYPHPSGKGGGKSGRKRKKQPKKLKRDLWGF